MVRVGTIARTELLRLLRDRSNIFFVFVFPLLLVVLIGSAFGEGAGESQVAVVAPDDDAAARIVERIDASASLRVVEADDVDDARDRVARGTVAVAVWIPEGFERALEAGETVEVGFVSRPDGGAASLRGVVDGAIGHEAAVAGAAHRAAAHTDVPAGELLGLARMLESRVGGAEVVTSEIGEDELAEEFAGLGQFDLGASSQLFLFTFLTALTGGVALIQTRQLGVARRMAVTPTPMRSILFGEAAGRVAVALAQATYIIVATVLLFRVDWGNPLATGVVVVLFCLVSGGAGMLLGAAASNESQAAGIGVGGGLGLAALGGSMAPLEVFPATMRMIANVTPHAWANRAMAEIVRRDGGLGDVLVEVAVLAGFAATLLALATWQLRRVIVR